MKGRSRWLLVVAVVALLGAGTASAAVMKLGGSSASSTPATVIFAQTAFRDLQNTLAETGTLGHKTQRTVTAAAQSQVSAVYAQANSTARAGDPLFALGGRTAVAEQGTTPFFRPLGLGDEGNDVAQLNRILASSGDDPGSAGPVFTSGTLSALARWQAAHGYPDTTPASASSVTMALQPGSGYTLGAQAAAGSVIQPPNTPIAPLPPVPAAPRAATEPGATGIGAHTASLVRPNVAPTMQISGSTTITQGTSAILTITASTPVAQDTQIFLTVGGSAVAGTDYAPVAPVTLMPAGGLTATFQISALTPQLIPVNQPFVVVSIATSPAGSYTVGTPSAATVNIAPASGSAASPTLTLSSATAYLQKGKPFPVTISLSQPIAQSLTVNLAYGGTAVPNLDFIPLAGGITVPAGQTQVVVNVPTVADNLVEADKVLSVGLASGTYLIGNPSNAAVTITDTRAPALQLAGSVSVTPGGGAVLTIVSDQPPTKDIQVVLGVSGDAQAGSDYQMIDPTVVLAAGTLSASVRINTLANAVLQPDRHLVVSIQPSPAGAYTLASPSTAVVTILGAARAAGQPVLTLTSPITYLQKGKPYQVTVSLGQAITVPVLVKLVYGGTAQPGTDFTPPGGQILIPAGQSSVTVTIPTVADNVVQPDRVLTVGLAPSHDYLIGDLALAAVTITSTVVPTINVSASTGSVAEGGSVIFTITADQPPTKNTAVNFAMGGTAQPGRDFEPLVGTVVLPAGQTSTLVVLQSIRKDVSFQPTDMVVGQWPNRIGQVYVKAGNTVAPGGAILDLTQPDSTVVMQASASDRTQLQVGQSCTMTISGGQNELSGTITELDSEPTVVTAAASGPTAASAAQNQQQVFQGQIEVSDLTAADQAADGATVSITVVVQEAKNALTVPIAAVKQNGTGTQVVRVVDLRSGRVTETPVKTGLSSGSYIQINSGLQPGATVVVQVNKP